MAVSQTSPYHTPTPTAISNTFIISDKNNPTSVRSATQPIPVKMVMSNVCVEPQQGVLIDTASNTPVSSAKATTTTMDPTNMNVTLPSEGLLKTENIIDVGVGATNGNGGSTMPRFVLQQASLSPNQLQVFSTSSSSLFFDKYNKRSQDQSSPTTSAASSSTSSDKAVEATKPKSATLGIIPSPHDNNKTFKSIVGIPCLVKQQSPASTIKEKSSHQPIILDNSSNNDPPSPSQQTPGSTTWLHLLNTLKEQIQQIQHERQQEKMAYLAREMERRELEQKMLNEIQKTGEQLAMFTRELQHDRKQHQRRYRSKSAERQQQPSSTSLDEKLNSARPGGQPRPHSFSATTISTPFEQQQQQSDYHSAMEDDSDHDNKSSKGKGKSSRSTHNNGVSSLVTISTSSSSSTASSGNISSLASNGEYVNDDDDDDMQLHQRKDHHQRHRPLSNHRHNEETRRSRGQGSPSSKLPPQKHKSQRSSLPLYTWTANPGYYPPPPQIHPPHLPPHLPNQYHHHPSTPWMQQQIHGNNNRNPPTTPSSYYTFPPMIPPPLTSNEGRRYHPSSSTASQPPPSSLQQQQPPSSHSSTTSSNQYRSLPPSSSSSSSSSYPHRMSRHIHPPFIPPSLFLPPHPTEKSGLFM
ncbi:hypothetical protein BC941DRAFT_511044 [Chlamydoabsidia padenii]|nr:hypothetical protein BC941DRAFT_511044 [Chlamydoabsidia padenii]